MTNNVGQPQRFCRSCGAEVRSGTSFCVSCGASLTREPAEPTTNDPRERLSGHDHPPAAPMMDAFESTKQRLKGAFVNLRRTSLGEGPRNILGRLSDLPPAIKMLLAGAVLLVLVVLLSPVMRVVAIFALLVSVAFLILNAMRRRFAPRWAVAAVVSLILIPVFGGISGVIYHGDDDQLAGGSNPNPDRSASPSPDAGPASSPPPAALEPGDEVTITAQPFGSPEGIDYDGRPMTGAVFEYEGQRIMVLADIVSSANSQLTAAGAYTITGNEAPTATVHGEYQGVVSLADGRSYEAILADSIEFQ